MPASIIVRAATGRKDIRAFLNLPKFIYKDDPLWAPQIRLFERSEMHRGTNSVLSRSPHALLLAVDDTGRPRGRMIVYEDPRYTGHYGKRVGFFGSFEADGPEAAEALLSEGDRWFISQGLKELIGPIDPVAECWGFTIDGFSRPPVFMSPHNPRRYPEWMEAAGFTKAKDLLVYEVDTRKGYRIPERYIRFEKMFFQRNPGFSARRFNIRDFDAEVERIVEITNEGVNGNWGFVPVQDDERDALAARLKPIVDPDVLWFIEHEGKPVACSMGFPDLNIPIRKSGGRLLPFGWWGLIRARKRLEDYRLWSLAVRPAYHGRGLDALLYINLYRAIKARKKGLRLEANYVLEDNPHIVIGLEKLGLERIKSYRVFGKTLQ